jgi:copper(I)-binding protein
VGSARPVLAAAFAAALALASPARGEPTLANAWLRPAAAGDEEAQVYVDIRSTEALELVAARSPVARGAVLVRVDPPDPDPTARKVVSSIPVAADRETRLAYLGSHVRLTGITKDLVPGMRIPLELTFADPRGRRQTLATEALVRGLVPRRPADAPPATGTANADRPPGTAPAPSR